MAVAFAAADDDEDRPPPFSPRDRRKWKKFRRWRSFKRMSVGFSPATETTSNRERTVLTRWWWCRDGMLLLRSKLTNCRCCRRPSVSEVWTRSFGRTDGPHPHTRSRPWDEGPTATTTLLSQTDASTILLCGTYNIIIVVVCRWPASGPELKSTAQDDNTISDGSFKNSSCH